MRMLAAILLAFTTTVGSACASAPAPVAEPDDGDAPTGPAGEIAGVVRDGDGQSGVSFAGIEAVSADGRRAVDTTDAEGAFRLRLAPGRYRVTASYAGLRPATAEVDVVDRRAVRVDLTLALETRAAHSGVPDMKAGGTPTAGTIEGIISTDGTEPFPGAVVAAMSPSLVDSPMAISSDRGRYRIPGLPPGRYDLTVYYQLIDRGSIELRRTDIEVRAGHVTKVDLEIDLRVKR